MGEKKREREKGASFFENLLVITEIITVRYSTNITYLILTNPLK